MANRVNIGIRIPVVAPYDVAAVREFVQEAERQGFHSVWVGDHVYHRMDLVQPLSMLSWVAALTSRVRLGTAVMLTAFLNPVLFAREVATLDYLSEGRLTLGISFGGTEAEYGSIGVPIKQRPSRLVENVEIARKLWSEDEVNYEGRYHHIQSGRINPKPVQKPGVPLWFGGGSEPSMRRTSQLADGWIAGAGGPPEGWLDQTKTMLSYVGEAGRDASTFGVGKLQSVSVDPDPKRARQLAEKQWQTYYGPNWDVDRNCIEGDSETVAARIATLATVEAEEATIVLEPSDLTAGQLALLRETVASVPGVALA